MSLKYINEAECSSQGATTTPPPKKKNSADKERNWKLV